VGLSPLTDSLDAERQLLAAQDQLAQLRADSDRAAVATFRAMGGAAGEPPATGKVTRQADATPPNANVTR
jgi:outer membrane protein TolC